MASPICLRSFTDRVRCAEIRAVCADGNQHGHRDGYRRRWVDCGERLTRDEAIPRSSTDIAETDGNRNGRRSSGSGTNSMSNAGAGFATFELSPDGELSGGSNGKNTKRRFCHMSARVDQVGQAHQDVGEQRLLRVDDGEERQAIGKMVQDESQRIAGGQSARLRTLRQSEWRGVRSAVTCPTQFPSDREGPWAGHRPGTEMFPGVPARYSPFRGPSVVSWALRGR